MARLNNINWKEVIGGQTAKQFIDSAGESTIEEAALAQCRRLDGNWSKYFPKGVTKEVAAWGLVNYLSKEIDK